MAEIMTTTDVSTATKEWVLEEIEENDHLVPTSSAADTASSEEDDDSSSASVDVKEQEQEQEQEQEKEQEQPQSSEQPPKDNQEAEQEVIVLTEDNQLTYEENSDVVEIAETRMSTQVIVEDSETVTKSLEVQQSNTATASHETSESSNQNEEIKAKEEAEEETGVEGDDDEAEGAALDRRMTYIGEGLLDVGSMDAIDRLSDLSAYSDLESMTAAEDQKSAADVSSRHMSIDENCEFNLETQSPEGAKTSEAAAAASTSDESHSSQTTSAPPATPNKLLAFLAKGSEQKLASVNSPPPAATVVAAPKSTPAVLRPLPPPPSPQAPMAAPVKPQLPTVSIENRRSKLLDFLANDVGERYLDGVYQEETRDDQGDTTTDDEQDYNSEDGGVKKSEDEQEQSRQRRVKRANSKLLAFLAKERGERLHRVERGSEDASAQRNSISSETSSTSADGEHHHQHQHAQPKSTSKLLDFVSKVVPDKPKFVIFDPADAVSETEELEHLVAEEAQKKKMKRENREKARQKVLGLLAEENTHTVAASGASHSKHQASSTVKSVDETKVQREKVTDRYGREGLLDFLDRTEAAQQRKIRWATSRNSSSSGSSSPSSSTTSSPKSSLLPPPPGTPTATSPASSRSQPARAIVAPPAVVSPPSPPPPPPAPRSAPHATNRLASFLSKITSKASYSPQVPPRHESPAPAAPKQIAKSPITVPAPPAASVRDEAPLTSPASSPMTSPARSVDSVEAAATPVKADDAIAALSKSSTQKVQPVLTALSQISQTCASHELNDVAIARITTLLNSISQIVKEDVQKRSRGEPVRRWSNASSSSPSWVKSGKEIEEFDKKHASVMTFSHATATASTLEISSNPAVLERSSEPKVTVATSVLQSFNDFESAQNLLEIVAAFHKLLTDCGLTDLKLAQPWAVYDHVKSAVASKLGFRQKQLFKLLDAKFNGDVYNKKPAARKRVCIIGAGPVGLRAAVEMALLGAQVVVLEKRKHFSRENILHLWPWVVQDLTSLGAKVLFPQFCHSTAYFHVGTRQLQCILLKVALLLGVTFFPATTFEGIAHPDSLDSGRRPFYTIVTKPQVPWMEFTAVLGACGTQDRLSDQARIKRFVFSRKEAIGLVCYFPNHGTTEEKNVAEFSWTIQFKQQMFAKMREVGVDLENIVYYRGEMHYLVMTPKRQNLLDQGVLKLDYPNVSDLVLDDNIDKLVLHDYLKRVVDFVKIPQKAEFSRVRIFDFSSRTRADKAASILTSKGKKLYVGLIGDSLMEPFWPEGLGTCRGFLSALDGCWMVAQVGFSSDEQLLADRELAYRVIQHVSGFRRDDLQKNVRKYSVDPKTRYVVKFPQLC